MRPSGVSSGRQYHSTFATSSRRALAKLSILATCTLIRGGLQEATHTVFKSRDAHMGLLDQSAYAQLLTHSASFSPRTRTLSPTADKRKVRSVSFAGLAKSQACEEPSIMPGITDRYLSSPGNAVSCGASRSHARSFAPVCTNKVFDRGVWLRAPRVLRSHRCGLNGKMKHARLPLFGSELPVSSTDYLLVLRQAGGMVATGPYMYRLEQTC